MLVGTRASHCIMLHYTMIEGTCESITHLLGLILLATRGRWRGWEEVSLMTRSYTTIKETCASTHTCWAWFCWLPGAGGVGGKTCRSLKEAGTSGGRKWMTLTCL